MADVVGHILTFKDLISLGKEVYDTVQKVKSKFADVRNPLQQQLGVILSILQNYEKLYDDGKIRLGECVQADSAETAIDKAVGYLKKCIKNVEDYCEKVDSKGKWKQLFTAGRIEENFKSLTAELNTASDLMDKAMQPYILAQTTENQQATQKGRHYRLHF